MVVSNSLPAPNQLMFKSVHGIQSEDELLAQTGWFYLKEIFEILDPEQTGRYKLAFKQIERLKEQDKDPYLVMGYKKFGGRVGVLMERFSPWYCQNLLLKTRRLNANNNFKDFLNQDQGLYRLSEVCKVFENFIPYSYSILKRNADRQKNPRETLGIFKYDTTYLVEMPQFEQWLKSQLLN